MSTRFPFRALLAVALCAAAVVATAVRAEMIGGNPGPAYNFVCPNSDGKPPLDCYFDAVTHLYTMCKHVKSIEIIEFGYEQSTEGTNAAKSESCVTKMKLNMTRPYQAALKAVTRSKDAVEDLRQLNESWLKALASLGWIKGETDDDYKKRTMLPYEDFATRIVGVQTAMQRADEATALAKAKPAAKPPAKHAAKHAAPATTTAKASN
ncbi:MAG: hypothetical protein JSR18_16235 [Proteobacteria bacterium]|nr:hypothetical protein [Pseudomonadota bacterium]